MNQRKRIARKTAYARKLLTCPNLLLKYHWLKLQKEIRERERQYTTIDLRHVNIEDVAANFLARGNSDDIDASIYTTPNVTAQLMAMQLPNEDSRE